MRQVVSAFQLHLAIHSPSPHAPVRSVIVPLLGLWVWVCTYTLHGCIVCVHVCAWMHARLLVRFFYHFYACSCKLIFIQHYFVCPPRLRPLAFDLVEWTQLLLHAFCSKVNLIERTFASCMWCASSQTSLACARMHVLQWLNVLCVPCVL